MKELKVRLTFFEEILGTANADPEIHATYIASNAPDAPTRKEEIEAIGVEEIPGKIRFLNWTIIRVTRKKCGEIYC